MRKIEESGEQSFLAYQEWLDPGVFLFSLHDFFHFHSALDVLFLPLYLKMHHYCSQTFGGGLQKEGDG